MIILTLSPKHIAILPSYTWYKNTTELTWNNRVDTDFQLAVLRNHDVSQCMEKRRVNTLSDRFDHFISENNLYHERFLSL